METILITRATLADTQALTELVNNAYRGDTSRKGWTTEADLLVGSRTDEEALHAMLRNPQAAILKAQAANRLVGCVYLERKGEQLYLGMLTVLPEVQTNGIGKRLLQTAEQHALDQQCRSVTMTVITARPELIAWYQRRGYQPTGVTQPFPNDPRFGIPKQALEFVVLEKTLRSASPQTR